MPTISPKDGLPAASAALRAPPPQPLPARALRRRLTSPPRAAGRPLSAASRSSSGDSPAAARSERARADALDVHVRVGEQRQLQAFQQKAERMRDQPAVAGRGDARRPTRRRRTARRSRGLRPRRLRCAAAARANPAGRAAIASASRDVSLRDERAAALVQAGVAQLQRAHLDAVRRSHPSRRSRALRRAAPPPGWGSARGCRRARAPSPRRPHSSSTAGHAVTLTLCTVP